MIYRRKNVRICFLFLQINLLFFLGFSYLAVSTYWYGGATIPNIRNSIALTLLLLPGCSVAINKKKYIPAPRVTKLLGGVVYPHSISMEKKPEGFDFAEREKCFYN